jgi:lipase maturation factor 1
LWDTIGEPGAVVNRWLFLRLLGIVYLCAFASLALQVRGLIGSNGILPVADFLDTVRRNLDPQRYWLLPTLAWLNASNEFLQLLCWGGVLLSVLLIIGIAPIPVLALLWLLYLSLVNIGQDFMAFQWDILLLETGFLAIFFAPGCILPGLSREAAPSRTMLWLLRLLLFRLMFFSGVVKLRGGDPTWRDLTALAYHYETQPLPSPLAWYIHQLPLLFQQLSTAFTLVVELAVPFAIFAPRQLRLIGAGLLISLQVLIMLTGNFAFFNLLTITLCITLLDDDLIRRLLPGQAGRFVVAPIPRPAAARIRPWLVTPLAIVVLCLSAALLAGLFSRGALVPRAIRQLEAGAEPFHLVNSYGLFAFMTTERPEIIVEGSNDGKTWLPYTFAYKLGDVRRAPRWVAPHQPRLDWQMWFAALGDAQSTPWFSGFMLQLLRGSPDVLDLLEDNPFPDGPPRYVRALLYDYRFTSWSSAGADGAWWRRTQRRSYYSEVSIK